MTRVKELLEHGNNVAFAQDSITAYWYPLENGNMMNILDNGIHLPHYTHIDEINKAFDLITFNSANIMRVNDQYGIDADKPAKTSSSSTHRSRMKRFVSVLKYSHPIRNGEYLFKRAPRKNDTEIDFLRQ